MLSAQDLDFLGADLDARRVGAQVGRVAADDVPAAVDAICGAWESLRHGPETLGQTVERMGHDAFAAELGAAANCVGLVGTAFWTW